MWRNRNIWIILIGETIAGLGLWTGIIGNLEFLQEKIPSDFMKSIILSVGLLAGIITGPLAGRVIDQSKKKHVLIISGIGRMISVIFMLIAIETGSIWWMLAFLIGIQFSATFYFPALAATIPLVVKEEHLLTMNGLHMNVATVARVAGTALAGAMLVYWSIASLYWISMGAYAILLLMTIFLQIEEDSKKVDQTSSKAEGKRGFKEVFPVLKRYPAVSVTLVMTLIPLLFLGSFNLIVINISEIQQSSAIKGLIYTFEGAAFLVGSVMVKHLTSKWKTSTILFTFTAMVALSEALLVFSANTAVTLVAFTVLGFSLGCIFPTAMVIFQKQMPKEYHGRFFSFRNMLERVMFQVVLLVSGAFLDLLGLQNMVIILALISLACTAILYMQMKQRAIQLDLHTVQPTETI